MTINYRTFSTESDGERLNISQVLIDEVAAEKENAFEKDPELEKVKKAISRNFKIQDMKGLGLVELNGTYRNETISIKFDCQDEEEIENDEEYDEDESENENKLLKSGNPTGDVDDEEDPYGAETGINFEVQIKKQNGESVIALCTAASTLIIQNVRHLPAGKSETDESLYGGPSFDSLDDTVQAAFTEYLEDRGINEDMVYFILSYSKFKEQTEYVNWLEELTKFVAAK